MIRIGAGEHKGRRLAAPGEGTRPTSGKVRGAIMNILAAKLPGARVLDLFAGTGALGIEALSRGAMSAVFVENDRRAAEGIRTACATVGAEPTVRVQGSIEAIADLARSGERFDVVFLDPPYGRGLAAAALEALASSGIVAEKGEVVAEHRGTDRLPDEVAGIGASTLSRRSFRRHGDTAISVYRRQSVGSG